MGQPANRELLPWLSQVCARVSAASRGIAKLYPGRDTDLAMLAATLDRRIKAACLEHGCSALSDGPVFAALSGGDGGQGVRVQRALLLGLDRLLGRIAVREVGPESWLSEVTALLQRVQDHVTSGAASR